jgi:hypothetical protein
VAAVTLIQTPRARIVAPSREDNVVALPRGTGA